MPEETAVIESRAVFGKIVQLLLRKSGWHQNYLAHATGLSSNGVSRVTRGLCSPRLPTLTAIATAFNMRPSALLALHERAVELVIRDIKEAKYKGKFSPEQLIETGQVTIKVSAPQGMPFSADFFIENACRDALKGD
jgi:transcriptional regulator with XRE-family HTH domain